MPGVGDFIVEARAALLDAVAALEAQKDSVTLIGAQAIYLRTGSATFALAEATKDTDLAIDPRKLGEDPRLEEATTKGGFILDPVSRQPGAWMAQGNTRGPDGPRAPRWLRQSGSQHRTVSTTRTRTTSTDCWSQPRPPTWPRPCEALRRTRCPRTSRRRRSSTWSNSSQAHRPSVPRWPDALRKASANPIPFRLRRVSLRRTCCQSWPDPLENREHRFDWPADHRTGLRP